MSINKDLEERLKDIETKLDEINILVQEFRKIVNETHESNYESVDNSHLSPALQDTYDILNEKSPITSLEMSLITGR